MACLRERFRRFSDEECYCRGRCRCQRERSLEREVLREVSREVRRLTCEHRTRRAADAADDRGSRATNAGGVRGRGGRRGHRRATNAGGGGDGEGRRRATNAGVEGCGDGRRQPHAVPFPPGEATVHLNMEFRYRGRTRGTVPVSQPMAILRYLPVQRGDGRSMEWLYHHGGYYNFVHENHDPELVRGDRRLTRRIVFSAGTRPPVTGVEVPFPGGVWRVERFIFDGPQGQGGGYRGFETLYFLDER
ncbi:hypothetical protein TWF970_004205 [Orbilia oligospora]|uniref:Uncharacterized protein n=1 Tax=Orbilia oligospora TaxID=2813651 RepID=A0A7C8VH59_ORBOL|nr:hypothetical protein TWF970_004205 [Orbilia oligospora]